MTGVFKKARIISEVNLTYMLTDYIAKKLSWARYKILEDGTYFSEIPGLKGVWANEKNLEKCRQTLLEILEEWLILPAGSNL
ncbi:MAG: type II toxin-antitoxin system HicB family antitoxin [Candidatus Kuenenbacteria bacterium]